MAFEGAFIVDGGSESDREELVQKLGQTDRHNERVVLQEGNQMAIVFARHATDLWGVTIDHARKAAGGEEITFADVRGISAPGKHFGIIKIGAKPW